MKESNTVRSVANTQRTGKLRQPVVAIDAGPSSVSREFHNFLADIEDLVKETASFTGEELTWVKDKLNERIAMAKESVEAMDEEIVHQARQVATDTNNYVHEQPWQAIGMGAAAGLLLGLLLARRG